MYVRIIRGETGKEKLVPAPSGITTHPLPETPHKILLDLGDEHPRHYELHKGHDEAYVMNENGKTLDSYRWPVTPTGKETGQGIEVCSGDKVAFQQSEDSWRTGDVKKRDGQFVVDVEGEDPPDTKDLALLQSNQIAVLAPAGQDVSDVDTVQFRGESRALRDDGSYITTNGDIVYDGELGKLSVRSLKTEDLVIGA